MSTVEELDLYTKFNGKDFSLIFSDVDRLLGGYISDKPRDSFCFWHTTPKDVLAEKVLAAYRRHPDQPLFLQVVDEVIATKQQEVAENPYLLGLAGQIDNATVLRNMLN